MLKYEDLKEDSSYELVPRVALQLEIAIPWVKKKLQQVMSPVHLSSHQSTSNGNQVGYR